VAARETGLASAVHHIAMSLPLTPAAVIAVAASLPALASVAVALRYKAKHAKRVPLRIDDWAFLTGVGLVWGLAAIIIVGAAIGALGKHSLPNKAGTSIERGPDDDMAELVVMAYSIVEKLAFGTLKISIVLMYRRIFQQRWFQRLSTAVCVFLALWALAFLTTSSLQCRVRNWELWYVPWTLQNHCISAELSWVGFSISDVATDIFVLSLPLPIVWRLHMSQAKKLTTSVVMLLGLLSTAIGIAKMVVILYFTYTGTAGYRDLLGTMSTVLVWSIVEASTAIIATCLPAIRPLLLKSPPSSCASASAPRNTPFNFTKSSVREGTRQEHGNESRTRICGAASEAVFGYSNAGRKTSAEGHELVDYGDMAQRRGPGVV
jgi:hypothetical protein